MVYGVIKRFDGLRDIVWQHEISLLRVQKKMTKKKRQLVLRGQPDRGSPRGHAGVHFAALYFFNAVRGVAERTQLPRVTE